VNTPKILLAILLLALVTTIQGVGLCNNFTHIQTGGYDYAYDTIQNSPNEAAWLATHHDIIIGLGDWQTGRMPETLYDTMKRANPNARFYQYIAYNTMLPNMSTEMEAWCQANGRNAEELYYHYYNDTQVRLRNNQLVTFRGYGGGSAQTLKDARVPATWWSGQYPNINPTSQTFREAFKAYAANVITVNKANNKYCDGVLLDTFEGTVDTYFDIHLENTIELRNLGVTESAAARRRVTTDLLASKNDLEAYLSQYAGKTIRVIPNAADVDNVYQWFPDVYKNALASPYDELSIEFLITSGYTSLARIPRLKQVYDDMAAGFFFFINSQTNYEQNVPFNFTQFILAVHYLINHPNGCFSYHLGSASYYGGRDGTLQNTHWHKNIEYDLGKPTIRSQPDYWGEQNTDRFFVFADGGSQYKILGREYERALVLAKFGNVGGWANIGINPTTHELPGDFRRLLADNSLGPVIRQVTLGFAEGAILIKDAPAMTIAPPRNLRVISR